MGIIDMQNEKGFTFIELLVSIAIIGILGGVALSAFTLYKKQGYDAHVDSAIRDARNSLEAGQVNESVSNQNMMAVSDMNGRLIGRNVQELVPGLVVNPDVRLLVMHSGICANQGQQLCGGSRCCFTEWISARHCKGKLMKTWGVWNDGTMAVTEMPNVGC